MMTRLLVTVAAFATIGAPLQAQDSITITGRVVDVSCFVTLGKSGADHRHCTAACARAGVPLGILSTDGTLYMPVSSKPSDQQNPRLAKFAEGSVKVTGTHRLNAGMHTIEISTIEAAPGR